MDSAGLAGVSGPLSSDRLRAPFILAARVLRPIWLERIIYTEEQPTITYLEKYTSEHL
jgi:hypothetical protein